MCENAGKDAIGMNLARGNNAGVDEKWEERKRQIKNKKKQRRRSFGNNIKKREIEKRHERRKVWKVLQRGITNIS